MTASDDPRLRLRSSFDALSATYDHLRFLRVAASRLAEIAPLRSNARVLDVATGTGVVALAVARNIGSTGRVVGLDISPEMLARAREKAAAHGLTNVEFREGDAEHLDFPDRYFDVVLCAAALFFVPNILGALQEWHRVLAPGGWVGFSSFGPSFLQPLRGLWESRLQEYGLKPAALPTHRLESPAVCQELLGEAGFTQIEVRREQVGYHLKSAGERWEDIQAGLEGKPFLQLNEVQRDQAKTAHLAEVTALATPEGIWVDVPAIYATGRRGAAD